MVSNGRRPEMILAAAAVTMAMAAGCQAPAESSDSGPSAGPFDGALYAGCDQAALHERVRAREIDVASDPGDRKQVAAAFIASPPSSRDRAPYDFPTWHAVARSQDGGATWAHSLIPGYPGDSNGQNGPLAGSESTSNPAVLFLADKTLLVSGVTNLPYARVFVARYSPQSLVPESIAVVAAGSLRAPPPASIWLPTPFYTVLAQHTALAQNPSTGTVFATWESYDVANGTGTISVILMARSLDGGRTWSEAANLTPERRYDRSAAPGTEGTWALPFVTVDGRLHVQWKEQSNGTLIEVVSDDDGRTFRSPRSIEVDHAKTLRGVRIEVDRTGGVYNGRAYMSWQGRDADGWNHFAAFSTDNASTWRPSIRINLISYPIIEGFGAPKGSVAVGATGDVGVVYHDERPRESARWGAGSYWTYVATSSDGGQTWKNHLVSKAPTDVGRVTNYDAHVLPVDDPSGYGGDAFGRTRYGGYDGIAASTSGFVALWQDGRDGTPQIPYSTVFGCRVAS